MKHYVDPLSIYTHFDAELWNAVHTGELIHQDDNAEQQTPEALILKKADDACFDLSFSSVLGRLDAQNAAYDFVQQNPSDTRFPPSYCQTRIFLPLLRMLRGGIALHASAVSIDSQATLLLAPSGVGKSTCGAALMAFASHTKMISDDTVVVTKQNDTFWALPATQTFAMRHNLIPLTDAFITTQYGSLTQKNFISILPERTQNNAVPLKRLVFLHHGQTALHPIQSFEALSCFFAQQFVLTNAPNNFKRFQFATSTELLNTTPCFSLGIDFSTLEGIKRAADILL